MATLNYPLLLAFLAIMAFQACKTRQKTVQNKQSDTTNISIASKDTIFNDQMSDTICYIFSADDISKIKQQMPYEIFLQPDKPYYLYELCYDIQMQYGQEAASKFVAIAKNYGKKTTWQKQIEENTQYYLKAIDDEGYVYPLIENKDPVSIVKLGKVNNIPPNINNLFANYPIFNTENVMGYIKHKQLSTIYKGELLPLSKLINIAIKENGEKLHLNFEEETNIFFTIIKGFDTKFSIKQITEIPFIDPKIGSNGNYDIILITDGKEEKYNFYYRYSQFGDVSKIEGNKGYSVANPITY